MEDIRLAFDLSMPSLVSLVVMAGILVLCSYYDLRDGRVSNQVLLLLGIVGLAMVSITGQLFAEWILHATATVTFLVLGYALFRQGAIGGADLKTSLIIGIVSPGVQLGTWTDPVFEAFIASTVQLAVMLFLGYLYWKIPGRPESQPVPLIPSLLFAYLLVQVLALV